MHAPAYVSSDDVVIAKSEKSIYAVYMEVELTASGSELKIII